MAQHRQVFRPNFIQRGPNRTTITFNQRDEAMLSRRFTTLPPYLREVPSRKYAWPIHGLVSRSFEYPPEIPATEIQNLFFNLSVWIKYGLKSVEQSEICSNNREEYGNLADTLFGFLPTNVNYVWTEGILNDYNLRWKINHRQQYFCIIHQTKALRFNKDCLMKYFIISTAYPTYSVIILPLKVPPRCFTDSSNSGRFNNRTINPEIFSTACLADSSAVWLRFYDQNSLLICSDFLMKVLNMDRHYGPIRCDQMPPQTWLPNLTSSDFWSNYAYHMLLALGYRIKSQITINTLQKIIDLSLKSQGKPYSTNECYLKLTAIYSRAFRNHFFDINQEFDSIQPMSSSVILDQWEYVPRIYLTPYGVYPLPVNPLRGNRILRERQLFGPREHFCQVMLRDIDFGPPRYTFIKEKTNEQWIKNLFCGVDTITVGNRTFHFLLCSSSQLRDRRFWFHAPYENRRAHDIRQWMGDFSHEKSVATRIARMALTLTCTTATITLLPDQIERIDDKYDADGRQFTDGVGKISPMALRETLKKLNPKLIEGDYMPSVIQIRLNGIKGVLALAPDLADRGILIQYRDSQHKFKANHNVLEIIKHASSGKAVLNRPLIMLLENMGIPEHIFLKLQNEVRMKICKSLLDNKSAQDTLKNDVEFCNWERMHLSGIELTREPFSHGLLSVLALEQLRRLKEKSQVPMSRSDGRMLLGAVDETDSLRYGQVFIQLRDLDGRKQVKVNRKVLVTRNPAHFPGDIRLLDAVDCRALHHLSECIVFPAEGPRPHPNEMSGGDLDGDEYWICWKDDFVNNATEQYVPAKFDTVEKPEYPGEITMEVIAEFLFKYFCDDSFALLAHDHLRCCDRHKPNHEYSLSLAKAISQAVDFIKTGIPPKIPEDFNLTEHPDFLEKKDGKSYQSISSIGVMYRQVKEVWNIHSTWQEQIEEQPVSVDPNLLIEGYEGFISEAKEDYQYYSSRMNTILWIYNLQTEYELITGCHLCPKEESKNNYSEKTALLEFRELCTEMQDRFAEDSLDYEIRLCKASAWYYVAYTAGVILSFGWIMDQLMSDIIAQKSILHGEYEMWERIGKAMRRDRKIEKELKDMGLLRNLNDEELENCSNVERLGAQLLKIIGRFNESPNQQAYADKYLLFLHKVALGIL